MNKYIPSGINLCILKVYDKRLTKILNNNKDDYISIDSWNTYTVLQLMNSEEQTGSFFFSVRILPLNNWFRH